MLFTFRKKWIKLFDWCLPVANDPLRAYCKVCKTRLKISSAGKYSLAQHGNTNKHKSNKKYSPEEPKETEQIDFEDSEELPPISQFYRPFAHGLPEIHPPFLLPNNGNLPEENLRSIENDMNSTKEGVGKIFKNNFLSPSNQYKPLTKASFNDTGKVIITGVCSLNSDKSHPSNQNDNQTSNQKELPCVSSEVACLSEYESQNNLQDDGQSSEHNHFLYADPPARDSLVSQTFSDEMLEKNRHRDQASKQTSGQDELPILYVYEPLSEHNYGEVTVEDSNSQSAETSQASNRVSSNNPSLKMTFKKTNKKIDESVNAEKQSCRCLAPISASGNSEASLNTFHSQSEGASQDLNTYSLDAPTISHSPSDAERQSSSLINSIKHDHKNSEAAANGCPTQAIGTLQNSTTDSFEMTGFPQRKKTAVHRNNDFPRKIGSYLNRIRKAKRKFERECGNILKEFEGFLSEAILSKSLNFGEFDYMKPILNKYLSNPGSIDTSNFIKLLLLLCSNMSSSMLNENCFPKKKIKPHGRLQSSKSSISNDDATILNSSRDGEYEKCEKKKPSQLSKDNIVHHPSDM